VSKLLLFVFKFDKFGVFYINSLFKYLIVVVIAFLFVVATGSYSTYACGMICDYLPADLVTEMTNIYG